jgi:hypothetical protein
MGELDLPLWELEGNREDEEGNARISNSTRYSPLATGSLLLTNSWLKVKTLTK